MKLKAPQFATSLYRDLRDRHLLIPAIALVIAIIAVPVALRKPAESAPLPTAPAAGANTTAVTSAVLVDDSVDVREYQKRLAKLKSKNPFDQRFEIAGSGGSDQAGSGTGAGQTSDVVATDTGTAPPTGSDTTSTSTDMSTVTPTAPSGTPTAPPTGSDETSTGDGSNGGSSGGSGDGSTGTGDQTQPEIRFVAGRVDVSFGPVGKGKEYNNVKYLSFLPDDETPIVAFVGLSEQGAGKGAVFALSSLAEVGEGDGTCALHKPYPCQFLTLKPGDSRFIKYEGKSYRLNVTDTRMIAVDDPSDATAGGDDSVTEGDAGQTGGNGGTATP